MLRTRLSDSLPAGRLSVRQFVACSLNSREDVTSTKCQPSWASASRTALRLLEMSCTVLVKHRPPLQLIEFLLVDHGVDSGGKFNRSMLIVNDGRPCLWRFEIHRVSKQHQSCAVRERRI